MLSIKEEREKLGLKQVSVAKQLGISREYLSRIENNKVEPSEKTLKKIKHLLGIGDDLDDTNRKVIY